MRLDLPCPGVVPFRIVYGGEQTTGRGEVLNFIVPENSLDAVPALTA